MIDKAILPAGKAVTESFDWGELCWYVNASLGNAGEMTFGYCRIYPRHANPRHYHPNCEEILHVLSGHILHSLGSETAEMKSGDTIVIPPNIAHNAKNLSDSEDAVMIISFSAQNRQTIGE